MSNRALVALAGQVEGVAGSGRQPELGRIGPPQEVWIGEGSGLIALACGQQQQEQKQGSGVGALIL